MERFNLVSNYSPTGDQPTAIERLVDNISNGMKEQTLLGATGTGKTFTISNVIEKINKPTLVLAHNKTLAGQLYSEFKEFFPKNRVEYFISYYDYYQPEAYVPSKDLYIEKDSSINEEIDQMRHSATASLLERKDVIVVASVSCIYGIGDPEDYKNSMIVLRVNQQLDRDVLLEKLVSMQFTRNNVEFARGTFRVKGDVVEIIPTYESTNAVRVEFFDDVIERIREVDVVSGQVLKNNELVTIFPATHFVTNETKKEEAIQRIEDELVDQIAKFKAEGKLLEAQRIEQRTRYDIEMIKEIGSCSGVENYSRHLSLRAEGETPSTLMDFFGDDYLLVVDESHVSLPQVRGMYNGDRSRKQTLVDYGFRLPSALDNRPLKFDEFNEKIKQVIYVSATPGDYEVERCGEVVQQIIRPTGLLDPIIEVRPSKNQIDNLIKDIRTCVSKNERVLVTTLTIKMSEDLTAYLKETGIKVTYLHSEIKSLERIELIRSLRLGIYDVIVGINLLREGLDLPEVSLICILDADKEGFLRSERALIQTIGRAARNVNGKVIMYADKVTDSMRKAIEETYRRRKIQNTHNVVNNIVPQTIVKSVRDSISISKEIDLIAEEKGTRKLEELTKFEKRKLLDKLEKEMKEAAKNLEFERAATLRDVIFEIKAGI